MASKRKIKWILTDLEASKIGSTEWAVWIEKIENPEDGSNAVFRLMDGKNAVSDYKEIDVPKDGAIETACSKWASEYGLEECEVRAAILEQHSFASELAAEGTAETERPAPKAKNGEGLEREYEETDSGLLWNKPTKEGPMQTYLCNFTATITADTLFDDGAERWHQWQIEAYLYGRKFTFDVHASQFSSMNWVSEHIGARAVLNAGMMIKDRARHAIQVLSTDIQERAIYTHIGWRKFGNDWVYLHAQGVICPICPKSPMFLDGEPQRNPAINDRLSMYALPVPGNGQDLKAPILASMRLLEIAPYHVTVPVFCVTYRAAIREGTEAAYAHGPTGAKKTALAVLCQQHFGQGFSEKTLPGNWHSTDNSSEELAFLAKDALFVLDDFVRPSGRSESDRLDKMADRILRGTTGSGGRDRMRRDGTLRPPKPPRATPMVTGEELPTGRSLLARTVIIEIKDGDIDNDRLTACQKDGRDGLYAMAMAGFIQWLAPHRQEVLDRWATRLAIIRDSFSGLAPHSRTAPNLASFAMGFELFLWYSIDSGAVSKEEAKAKWTMACNALAKVAQHQAIHDREADPVQTYFQCLRERLSTGEVFLRKDGVPVTPEQKNATQIGWIDETNKIAYLHPETALTEARKIGVISLESKTLNRRIKDAGLIAMNEPSRDRILVRKTFDKKTSSFLSISLDTLMSETSDKSDKSDKMAQLDLPLVRFWSGDVRSLSDDENLSDNDNTLKK
jgi:hypothetical protein